MVVEQVLRHNFVLESPQTLYPIEERYFAYRCLDVC